MESLIIEDFKFFAPVRLGEKNAWAHLDTGALGNMIAEAEAHNLEEIEKRVMHGMLASALVWVLDKKRQAICISERDADVYA